MNYNARGEELPDDTPLELPLRFKRPPSLQDQIKAMVRSVLSQAAADQGMESFEEADDFDVSDDIDLRSHHELTPMQEEARYAKQDASDLDKVKAKEDDDRAPEVRAKKESSNVHDPRVGVDHEGTGGNGKVDSAVSGKRGAA